jgi:site-specific DNA recombinase
MKYVPESEIEYAFITMMNKLVFGHEFVLKPLLISLRGMSSDDTLESIQAIDKKLEENVEQRNVLVGLMTKKYLEPAVYNKSNNDMSPVKWTVFSRINSFVRRITKYFFHAALANNFLL